MDNRSFNSLPKAFIGVHDKTPDMRVLYVSANIRDVLRFDPSEVIGQSSLSFVANGNAEDYRAHFGGSSEDNVIIGKVYLRSNSEAPVYMKLVNFSCDGIAFNVCFVYRGMEPIRVERSPLHVQKFHKHAINGADLQISEQQLDRRYSLLTAHQERARQESSRMGGPVISTRKAPQACIILESLAEASETNAMGPRVLFASNSIDRVINADSSDVQGLFFLALVAAPDVAKAGRFLDRVMEADNIVIERLAMLADPLGTEEEGGSPRAVSVEIIAAGADDGAIMLCQLAGSSGSRFASARDDSSSGYMSLEEIISSEPETSDVADVWRIVG